MKQEAEQLVEMLAEQMKTENIAIQKIIKEVAEDPYTKFVYATWVTDIEDEE